MSAPRRVEVVPHDAAWATRFDAAAAELRGVLGAELVDVHHVGSTAVAGLAAKPVIDILAVVRTLGAVDGAEGALVALGYRPRGENGLAGRRYVVRESGGRRSEHVHAYRVGDPAVARHLAARDFLRAHPAEAATYAALKTELAARHADDPRGYSRGKDAFLAALEGRALAWTGGRGTG